MAVSLQIKLVTEALTKMGLSTDSTYHHHLPPTTSKITRSCEVARREKSRPRSFQVDFRSYNIYMIKYLEYKDEQVMTINSMPRWNVYDFLRHFIYIPLHLPPNATNLCLSLCPCIYLSIYLSIPITPETHLHNTMYIT